MIKIGTVNIDTSHAPAFADFLLKDGRARYTAVYNDGFRTDEEVEAFIKRFGLDKRYNCLDEMAKNIDLAFIQSCDWDRHIELCRPFVDAGVPVFVDKPVVGCMKDVEIVEEWVKNGKIIIGSSAMRYTFEHDEFFGIADRGDIIHLTASVGVDEFNYAIHAVEEIMGFMEDAKPVSTEYLGTSAEMDSYRIMFDNGVAAWYHICKKCWQPNTATIVTTKTSYVYNIDSSRVYEALLLRVCDYMEGKAERLASTSGLLDSIKAMLAGRKSKIQGGGVVEIASMTAADEGFDGLEFYNQYAEANRKK